MLDLIVYEVIKVSANGWIGFVAIMLGFLWALKWMATR